MKETRYLSAEEAAKELGVSHATLYAYVSRGLIRSESTGSDKRARRYRAEDILRLKERKENRSNPQRVAASALHWGAPVLDSAITLIANGKLYYRGQDANILAQTRSVEEVAALIWTGDSDTNADALFGGSSQISLRLREMLQSLNDLTPVEKFHMMLPLKAVEDLAAYDLRPESVMSTGARILKLMALIASGRLDDTAEGTLSEVIQGGWLPDSPEAEPLIRAALILCADHELNVSSFSARCVASAGSTPYSAVMAGLAALQGTRHGGHSERVEAFLREAGSPEGARRVIAGRLKRGERIPGFGHRLYPDGDPRARALLEWTAQTYPDSPAVALANAVVQSTYELIGRHPALDFGLAALSQALRLPDGGAVALFAMGRTIGWIGHAVEQYAIDRMIRPRARYIGEQPVNLQVDQALG
jgi:citrate synthase